MINVRRDTFETNSSSTHSLVMCSGDEYAKLKTGDALIKDESSIVTRNNKLDEIITDQYVLKRYLKYCKENNLKADNVNTIFDNIEDLNVTETIDTGRLCTLETFLDIDYLESFEDSYTTKSGEEVVAFGLYGYGG